jgi:hypothetical protein
MEKISKKNTYQDYLMPNDQPLAVKKYHYGYFLPMP